MAAGHFQLGNLVAIVDRNQMCIDGFTDDVMSVEPLDARFADFGWHVAAHRRSRPRGDPGHVLGPAPRRPGPAAGDHRRHHQGPRRGPHGAVARLARRQPRRRRLRRRDASSSSPACETDRSTERRRSDPRDVEDPVTSRTRPRSSVARPPAATQPARPAGRRTAATRQRAIPAFVLGEELADLADHDERIAVLTADLAKANRPNDFAARHPRPLLQPRHRREEHDHASPPGWRPRASSPTPPRSPRSRRCSAASRSAPTARTRACRCA